MIRGFLKDYLVDEASDVRSLIEALGAARYDGVVLDIDLGNTLSMEETHAWFRQTFPQVQFPHGEIINALGVHEQSPVNGKYLLPMVKAASGDTRVFLLTGTVHDEALEHYSRTWGAQAIIPKLSEDLVIDAEPNFGGLKEELLANLEDAFETV